MREAEAHADEDKKRREEIELRNRADQAVYGAERMIKDAGEKLAASDKAAIEAADGGRQEGERQQRLRQPFRRRSII